jgi:uncharacterized protein YjbI with pentapeptide repeats
MSNFSIEIDHDLSSADLRGADLRGADLSGATGVTEEQLARVKIWPSSNPSLQLG